MAGVTKNATAGYEIGSFVCYDVIFSLCSAAGLVRKTMKIKK
jgi:hypothetical protein